MKWVKKSLNSPKTNGKRANGEANGEAEPLPPLSPDYKPMQQKGMLSRKPGYLQYQSGQATLGQ